MICSVPGLVALMPLITSCRYGSQTAKKPILMLLFCLASDTEIDRYKQEADLNIADSIAKKVEFSVA